MNILCTYTVLTASDVFNLLRTCSRITFRTFGSLRLEYTKFKPFRKGKRVSKEHSRYQGENKNTKIDSNLFLHSRFLRYGHPFRSLLASTFSSTEAGRENDDPAEGTAEETAAKWMPMLGASKITSCGHMMNNQRVNVNLMGSPEFGTPRHLIQWTRNID